LGLLDHVLDDLGQGLSSFRASLETVGWRGRVNVNGGSKVLFFFRPPTKVSPYLYDRVEGGDDLR